MRKIIFTILVLTTVNSFSQPITINSIDIPVPAGTFNNVEYSPLAPSPPTPGNNQTWDYSSFVATALILNNFQSVTDTFFTNTGVDVQQHRFKELNSASGYDVISEIDFNTNSVDESGIEIPYQAYDLSGVTGSTQDSLIFPLQKYHLGSPSTLMQFPFTANSSWHSMSRHSNDFLLSVSAYALNHAPGKHVYWTYRNDSIVGWGKLRVYTTSGPSMWYDVLMDKYEEYSLDSFYLNGSPAPVLLLNAFSVAQGQKSNAGYGYDFFRAGSFNYLVRFDYSTDSTFSLLTGSFQNIDNILGTNELPGMNYSSLVFPNPVSDAINIKIFGQHAVASEYEISDITGKIAQKGIVNGGEETIRIPVTIFSNGTYMLTIKDKSGNKLVTEEIIVRK